MSVTTFPAETTQEPAIETDSLYEIVDGQRVEKPPMGNFQVIVASLLAEKLAPYTRAQGMGRVVTEMLFKLHPEGGRKRRPDVAFVSYKRWERGRKINIEDGWDVIPDLAIEVVSPSNPAGEVVEKVQEYFQAGVLRVWVIYPSVRQVYDYESPLKVKVLKEGDELEGGELLQGFRLSLAELFEDGE